MYIQPTLCKETVKNAAKLHCRGYGVNHNFWVIPQCAITTFGYSKTRGHNFLVTKGYFHYFCGRKQIFSKDGLHRNGASDRHEFYWTHHRRSRIPDDRNVPSDCNQGGISFRHPLLVGVSHSWTRRNRSISLHRPLYMVYPSRRIRVLMLLEHTRNLRTAEKGGKRLVSGQSEAKRRI